MKELIKQMEKRFPWHSQFDFKGEYVGSYTKPNSFFFHPLIGTFVCFGSKHFPKLYGFKIKSVKCKD